MGKKKQIIHLTKRRSTTQDMSSIRLILTDAKLMSNSIDLDKINENLQNIKLDMLKTFDMSKLPEHADV